MSHQSGQFFHEFGGDQRRQTGGILTGIELDNVGADDGSVEIGEEAQHVSDGQTAWLAM